METPTIQSNEDAQLHYADQFEQGLISLDDYLTAYYHDLISRGETPKNAQIAVKLEKERIEALLFSKLKEA